MTQQTATDDLFEQALQGLRDAMTGLRFGTVALTVHDGQLVQIDITEKKRLTFKPRS